MTFQTNKDYLMNWITSEAKLRWTVIKRTAKTVTLQSMHGETTNRRIKTDKKGNEYCEPLGRYSMSPVLRATNIIK